MVKILQKRIQRRHTEDEMRQALHDFVLMGGGVQPLPQNDDPHAVLSDCIEELLESRATIEEIKAFVQSWSAKFQRK